MLRKLAITVLAATFALSLVPVPALAEGGSLVSGMARGVSAQALPAADYSWYTAAPSSPAFTVSTANQLVGFADLVNGTAPASVASGAVDFAGSSVSLRANATYSLGAGEWVPIGDAAHPFKGAFDGNGSTVDNFTVSGNARDAYLGLFGYVGAPGSVSGVTVGASAQVGVVREAADAAPVHHIAGVAGYCGGAMSNCTNRAPVTVETAAVQTAETPQVVYAVGGVAGECVFDMSDCVNEHSAAMSVRATSDPVGSVDNSGLVYYVGGVVGVLGDSSRIGAEDNTVATDPSKHGSLSSCSNRAKVVLDTPSTAGKDRFGETAYARSVCVGGVVGYSQGSVTGCVNGRLAADTAIRSEQGYIRGEHASEVGGIVGSLRGLVGADNPQTRPERDDGMAGGGNDPIEVADCVNYGDVYALNAAGGIVGYAGTYTTITGCVNSDKQSGGNKVGSWVVATRWNKPAPAGIVGSTNGTVSYCANFATVASGSWANEELRTITTASGYYAAGIAGMASYYSKVNASTQVSERTSPMPEVYGCYNVGSVLAVSGMRQRGIIGENEGYCHDNVLLEGVVENDKIAYGDDPADTEAHGTSLNNHVLGSAELRDKSAVAKLNAAGAGGSWMRYWVMSVASATASVSAHYGYPVLMSANPVTADDRVDLSSWTAVCSANAAYTGAAAVPEIAVSSGAATLMQNVDFYVAPQSGAVELSDVAGAYEATVVGIGAYKGQVSGVPYRIVKGRLSECGVTIESTTYNFKGQYPAKERIAVTSSGGAMIDADEYVIASVARAGVNFAPDNPPVNKGEYQVTLKVAASSSHFDTENGDTVTGVYRISPADIMRNVDFSKASVDVGGAIYPWVSSSDEADIDHPKTTLSFAAGFPVKPRVTGLSYNGVDLVEGRDYRVVYGNPNSGEGDTLSHDANNSGVRGGVSVGCVAVRYVTGSNFSNYVNMFFNIADDGSSYQGMYRLYNPWSGEHLYTLDSQEYEQLGQVGWHQEGEAWIAPSVQGDPVYRLYNPWSGDHHYTVKEDEYNSLGLLGWEQEGVAFHSGSSSGVAVYCLFNPFEEVGTHHYTLDDAERRDMVAAGWRDEGVGWYGLP